MTERSKIIPILAALIIVAFVILVAGLLREKPTTSDHRAVPHEDRWGIYVLDLATEEVELIYSSSSQVSMLRLSNAGDRFVFSRRIDGDGDEREEICTLSVDGSDFRRLTNNDFWDLYPCWSPDDSRIAFLSWRDSNLDIYVMDADGGNVQRLYDSGFHDADIHWVGNRIAFTRNSQVWVVKDDGTEAVQVTDPPKAGEWGNAVLPFGDYDPRFSPDGTKIAFERLVGDNITHGNYDIYVINSDGSGETRLTENGYTQGLVVWSHSGDIMVYLVGAIGGQAKYRIYMMNSDGTNNHDMTPDYFPAAFLCREPIFSVDDSKIFFVGQWWE